MQPKTIQLFIGIFCILLAIALFPYVQGLLPKTNTTKVVKAFPLASFTRETTQKITVSKNTASVTLTKDGSNWKVNGYMVSKTALESLFTNISTSSIGEVVSRNSQNHSSFGVATESATLLTFTSANEEKQFLFGNPTPQTGSVYARTKESDLVYQVQTSLPSVVFTTVDEWREKAIVTLESSSITGLELSGGLPPIFLVKIDDKSWELGLSGTKKTIADSDARPVITGLSQLVASGFYTPEELQAKTLPPAQTLVYKDKDGKELAKISLQKDGEHYVVTKEGATDIYKVTQSLIEPLFALPTKGT